MYTYCLINWMASSYFIPLSISARATSTGALHHTHTHTHTHTHSLIPGNITVHIFCVCTAHRNNRFSRKSDPFSPSQQGYNLLNVRKGLQLQYIFFEWKDTLLYSLHYSLFITKSYYMASILNIVLHNPNTILYSKRRAEKHILQYFSFCMDESHTGLEWHEGE